MSDKPFALKNLTEVFKLDYAPGAYPDEIIDVLPYIFIQDVSINNNRTELNITLVCNHIIKKSVRIFIVERITEDVFKGKKININLIERYRFENKNLQEIHDIWQSYKEELAFETKKNHIDFYLMLFIDCAKFEIKELVPNEINGGVEINIDVNFREAYTDKEKKLAEYIEDVFVRRFNLKKALININLIKGK